MKSTLPVAAVALGIALVAASALWGVLFPASNTWTEEKAARMRELSGKAHRLSFEAAAAKERPSMTAGRGAAEAQAAYDAARAELKILRDEFEGARDKPKTMGRYLSWVGAAMVLAGGLAAMSGRNS